MFFHEFSHTFVNNLINKIDIDLYWMKKIYGYLRDDYKQQYGNAKGMISEQIVRAVTASLVSLTDSEKASSLIEHDEKQSFILVPHIYRLLKEEYEKKRLIYPRFSDYIEILLNQLQYTV